MYQRYFQVQVELQPSTCYPQAFPVSFLSRISCITEYTSTQARNSGVILEKLLIHSFTVISSNKSCLFKYLKFSKFILFISSALPQQWYKLSFIKKKYLCLIYSVCVGGVTVSIKIRQLSTILKRYLMALSVQFPNPTPLATTSLISVTVG